MMAEFKVPESPRGCNGVQRERLRFRDERQLESRARGPKSNYRPSGARSRNNSCNSNSSGTDERYQSDRHLGALRSPLRTDSEPVSRRRDYRGGIQTRSFRNGNRTAHSSWKRDGDDKSKKPKRENSACAGQSEQCWRPDSVSDFPPLYNNNSKSTAAAGGANVTTPTDWGSLVELEEQAAAASAASRCVWLKPPQRTNPQLEISSEPSSAKTSPSKDTKAPSSPKRRFTSAELKTSEVKAMLVRRQKQIDYGKSMKCYEKYIQDVPQEKRVRNVHPTTPDRFTNYSRRGWDMLVKIWKKKLHHWEPTGGDANGGEQSMNDSSSCLASENTTFDELDVLDAEENVSELLLDQNVDEEV